MYGQLPYTVVMHGVRIHPTVSELIPTALSRTTDKPHLLSVEARRKIRQRPCSTRLCEARPARSCKSRPDRVTLA